MRQGEAIEFLLGVALIAIGASQYFGWANVSIVTGAFFVLGAAVPAWRRRKK